jgi:sec-independent protein translocase protein TatB
MFDIAWTEMLVIAVVMIVVVGPKELPGMLRTIGKTTAKLRTMAGEFRKQFDDALKEAELDDLKKLADDARRLNPAADIKKAFNPLETAGKDVRAGLAAAFNPPKAEPPKPKAPEPAAVAPAAPAATPAAPAPAAAAAMPAAVKPKAPAKAKAPSKPAPAKPAPAKPVAKKAAAPKKKTGGAAS